MKNIIRYMCAMMIVGAHTLMSDMITRGLISVQGGSGSTMTINQSGVQQLSSDFTGEIVISASNVVLDLRGFTVRGGTRGIRITGSNVMVQNGTVSGATIGVRVEGTNNYLFGLDFISNTTGVEIVSNANMVRNCNAFNNSSAGFSLVGASRNSFYNCTAIDNGSTGNAFGFVAQDGMANIFQDCIAERTQTTGSSPLVAAGFLLTGTEQKSKVLNCQANNANGPTAAGVWAKTLTVAGCTPSLNLLPSGTFNATYQIWGVGWLNIGASYYVASAGGPIAGPEFRVLQFNPASGLLSALPSATFEYNQVGRSVSWLTIGNSYYLAAGGDGISPSVRVLKFDSIAGLLSTLPSATFGTLQSYTTAWLVIGSSYYLAIGENGFARILQFNPTTGVLGAIPGALYTYGGFVFDVKWQQIGSSYYLAIAGNNLPRLRVLNFNPSTGSLSAVSTFEPSPSEDIYGCAWLQTGTNYYIGTGLDTVRAVQFNASTNTLTQVASNVGSWAAIKNDWLTIGDSYYLVCGSFLGSNNVNVFRFNQSAGTMSSIAQYSYTIGTVPYVWQPAWQVIGTSKYIAFGGSNSVVANPALVEILNFDDCQRYPQNNIFMQNQAMGNVTGFQDDLATTTGLNTTSQWLSNFSANNTTNFNIGTQFPISASKGTGDGMTENIDGALTTGGPAQKIMATISDQVARQITSRLDSIINNTPIAITGSTTLSADNAYYLPASLLSSVITITEVNYVSLDLNGNTIKNIVVTNSNFVIIKNGRVYPDNITIDGINILNSGNLLLDSVDTASGLRGLRLNNSTSNDSSLMVRNCTFYTNHDRGVDIVYPTKDYYFYDCVSSNNGFGGFITNGFNGKFWLCSEYLDSRRTSTSGYEALATCAGNLFVECLARNPAVVAGSIGFNITGTNVVAACYTRGFTTPYAPAARFGGTAASNTGNVEYWRNTQQ